MDGYLQTTVATEKQMTVRKHTHACMAAQVSPSIHSHCQLTPVTNAKLFSNRSADESVSAILDYDRKQIEQKPNTHVSSCLGQAGMLTDMPQRSTYKECRAKVRKTVVNCRILFT